MSSINNKEKNFISAVVYLHNDGARAVEFCRAVAAELDSHFAQYELVVVDDACTDDTVERLRAWGKDQAAPLTILHMSLYHGLENAMNAGLDASIGDYVYEFDSTELCYPAAMIFDAYRTALQGSDIVSVCPKATRSGREFPQQLPAAHRCVPAGHPAGHQPCACQQRPPALPQGGLCGLRLKNDRPGI